MAPDLAELPDESNESFETYEAGPSDEGASDQGDDGAAVVEE